MHMSKVATRSFRVALLCVTIASLASAQELPFSRAEIGNDTARAMSTLARQAIAAFKDDNRARYLDNLFRLQLVAGRYTDATTTLRSLRALEAKGDSRQTGATLLLYSIYARAPPVVMDRPSTRHSKGHSAKS